MNFYLLDMIVHVAAGGVRYAVTQEVLMDALREGLPAGTVEQAREAFENRGYAVVRSIFFNGSLLHGSGRNTTTDRFRRSFIGHYVGVSCETISESYHPLVSMDGRDMVRGVTTDGGPCGGWVGAAH